MGRATRWLRGLLGVKKPGSDSNSASASASDPYPPKEKKKKKKKKKRWAFAKSSKEEEEKSKPKPPALAAERGGSDKDMAPHVMVYADEFDQNNAAAVVRLTRSGRRGAVAKREETAAVTIQAAFRGYLARRALRALRSLVKLQALVRGNIVRKQAAETLRRMYALARVQAKARAFRALRSEIERSNSNSSAARQRNWVEQWWRDDEKNAKILEVDPGKPTRGPCFPGSPCSRRSPCFAVCSDHPSYMADTESSKGKLRSYSAPRLRPELEKTSPSKRPSSLHDRFSFQVYYGSGRLDRLGMHV